MSEAKSKRPIAVTIAGLLFLVSGVSGIAYHARELKQVTENQEVVLVLIVRLLAIVGGVFILRGASWARWLAMIWIVYHVILSIGHTPMELAMHFIIAICVGFALFNPAANNYFRKNTDPITDKT